MIFGDSGLVARGLDKKKLNFFLVLKCFGGKACSSWG